MLKNAKCEKAIIKETNLTQLDRDLLTSSHWGTYGVDVTDGHVTALRDFEQDPDPSPIGH